MTSTRALLVVLACSSGSCIFGDDEGSSDPSVKSFLANATAKRYPDPRLPWKAREGTVRGFDVWVDQSQPTIHYEPKEALGALTAIAAIDGSVAVVFPPEDRVGLDIAWAGIDHDWQRVALTDLALEDVGALDAVGRGDTLHVLVRERRLPRRLHYYTWRPGGAVTHEEVARAEISGSHWYSERCADAAIRIAPEGEVDIVYRSDLPPEQGYDSRVWYARRAGDGQWNHQLVMDSEQPELQAQLPQMSDIGCRNVLTYDHFGTPYVATLWQSLPGNIARPDSVPDAMGADGPPKKVKAARPNPHGVWSAAPLQLADYPQDGIRFPGIFGLELHSYARQLVFDPSNQVSQFDCGRGGYQFYDEPDAAWHRPCPFEEYAPVLSTKERSVGLETWFGGNVHDAPYDSWSGVAKDGTVFVGGATDGTAGEPLSPPMAVRDLPTFMSTEPASGATSVDPDTSMRVRVNRAPEEGETFSLLLVDAVTGDAVDYPDLVVVKDNAQEMELRVAGGMHAGHTYRVMLQTSRRDGSMAVPYEWLYLDTPKPWFQFTVAGELEIENPNEYVNRLDCIDRNDDGHCAPPPVEPTPGELHLGFSHTTGPLADYWLEAPDGSHASATFTTGVVPSELVMTWSSYLDPDATYFIHVPDSLDPPLDPADTLVVMQTLHGPPRYRSTVPADGTMHVSTTEPIVITFDRAVYFDQNAITLKGSDGSTPSWTVVPQGDAMRIEHAPFAADTGYRLTITANIVEYTDNGAAPLYAAPFIVDFGTGDFVGLERPE